MPLMRLFIIVVKFVPRLDVVIPLVMILLSSINDVLGVRGDKLVVVNVVNEDVPVVAKVHPVAVTEG